MMSLQSALNRQQTPGILCNQLMFRRYYGADPMENNAAAARRYKPIGALNDVLRTMESAAEGQINDPAIFAA
jgi:hypothetical protein